MKKLFNWVLAAILTINGASVLTSCSSDNDDNPAQEQAKKNRKEFVEHTRATMKDLAENLNFTSWNAANNLNLNFNQSVLNNPEFEKAVLNAFMQKVKQSIKPVEEGSELAAMGYKMYGTVDFTDFNYRFTMNAEETGFDVEEAEEFEVIVKGFNPITQQFIPHNLRLTLKAGGDTSIKFLHASTQQPGLAIVFLFPSEFQFAIANKSTGSWENSFTGSFMNQATPLAGSEYAQLGRSNFSVSGTVNSHLNKMALTHDESSLSFSIANDRVNHTGEYAFSWSQNGLKRVDLTMKQSRDAEGGLANLDLSKFTSMSSILDVLTAWMTTRTLDEAKLTLLDDLTTTLSISDMTKALELARASASARRRYADEATIDQYTQQLNQLIKAEMTCKGVNQTIPMKLVTQKFGVDWWTMPAFNFADENGYVSLVDLLDPESVQYGINIIDHAAEPMQQSIIVVRQLLQYVQGLVNGFQQSQGE
ncbi:MAG: hypothetical protein J5545_10105 [Bacteroidaceae bacterium]|nr:hypothetical protein [Bacteroidaceae bacterium]